MPKLARRPLETIQTCDICEIIEPIWTTKFDTAKRIKQRISLVFEWSKGAGLFAGENPVASLSRALPTVQNQVTHRAAGANGSALERRLGGDHANVVIQPFEWDFVLSSAIRSDRTLLDAAGLSQRGQTQYRKRLA